MAKKKKARSDREWLQFGMSAQVARAAFPAGADLEKIAEDARVRFYRTGRTTRGVKLIGRWRNPANRNPLHSNWKTSEDNGQSLKGFFTSIIQRTGAAADMPEVKRAIRSEAARKGAETKRRKKREEEEKKAKRRAAALKGWVTKRKKAKAEKRKKK